MAQNNELTELHRLAQRISDETRSDEAPSAISACTKSINLALLRYGVVGSLDNGILQEIVPAFPDDLQLGSQLLPLSQESHARYAVRQMRRGYVYFFAKRPIEHELLLTMGADNYAQARGMDAARLDDSMSQNHDGWLLDGCIEADNEGNLKSLCWPNRNVLVQQFNFSGVVSIHDPGGIEELRVLFTPTRLTSGRIKAILANEDGLLDGLQSFDIKKLLRSPDVPQPDLIPMQRISDVYCEHVAFESRLRRRSTAADMQKPIRTLRDQLFPCPPATNEQWAGPRWGAIKGVQTYLAELGEPSGKRGQGAAIVLNDPIGITQELNNWRNAALENFKTGYLDLKATIRAKERHHVHGVRSIELATTNERLVRAASSFDHLQKSYGIFKVCADVKPQWERYRTALKHYEFEEKNWQAQIAKYESQERWDRQQAERSQANHEKTGSGADARTGGTHQESAERYRQQAEHLRNHEPVAVTELRKQAQARFEEVQAALKQADTSRPQYEAGFQNEYAPLVSQEKYEKIKDDYKHNWSEAEAHVAPRTDDHLTWLTSAPLLQALAYYEPGTTTDNLSEELIANAKEFAIQVGICMVGAEGSEDSHQLLMQNWWNPRDEINFTSIKNLATRTFCFNNTALHEQMQEMLEAATSLESLIERTGIDLQSQTPEQRSGIAEFTGYLNQFKKWSRDISKYMGFEKNIRSLERIDDDMAAIYTFSRQVLVKILAVGGTTGIDYGIYRFFRDIFIAPNASPALLERVAAQGLRGSQPLQSFSGINRSGWDAIMKEQNAVASFRLNSFIFAIDAINLLAALTKGVSGEGDFKAIYGAFMTTSGSLINMNASILEAAVRRKDMYSEASIRFTGLKAVGATMAAMGALPLLCRDARRSHSAMTEAFHNENWLLYALYGLRLMTNTYAITAVLYGVSSALGAHSVAVLDNLFALAGSGASSGAAAAETMAVRTLAARVFKPTTPITVALLIMVTGLTYGIELAESHRTLTVRRWLSRMALRTDNVDLLEVDVVHSADTDEGETVQVTRTTDLFPTLKDEQDGLAVAIRTLTKGVPPELYEQTIEQDPPDTQPDQIST